MSEAFEDLLRRAFELRKEHRLQDARQLLLEAVVMGREGERRTDLAKALASLGHIERDSQRRDVALAHYEEAAAIYRSESNSLRLAHTDVRTSPNRTTARPTRFTAVTNRLLSSSWQMRSEDWPC